MTITVGIGLYLFTLGLVFGSFMNVVGLRIPKQESFTLDRSRCPCCHTTLRAYDLIPLFSWFTLKGKCRYCCTSISPLYPTMELFTGSLFVFAWLTFGWQPEFLIALLYILLLHGVMVSDLKYMLIPDKLLLFFVVPLIGLRFTIAPLGSWWEPLLGAGIGFMLLFTIAWASRGGMGGGDIKLFAVIGVVAGWQLTFLTFFLSVFLGALIGGIGLLSGHVKRGVPMPFGPFIVVGALVAYFIGESILDWYKGLWL
ncbi:prepilin peptidase [Salsuginibacillus kocurii]|uniref:prepilin peptidase n=1 Tax=Salsuginibacillus kocurii TaxID=427078 RepID=UPI00036B4336|nr:A24 family peptidase [Salsuginibacillus kocurii]